MSDLEQTFHKAMLNTYEEASRMGYRPAYFLRMVNELGGVAAARRLITGAEPTEGFGKLWELKRLDLTAEALVLKPDYAALFSDEERERARTRLAEVGYTPPWLDAAPTPAVAAATGSNTGSSLVERLGRAVQHVETTAATEVTGAEGGLSGREQVRIALQAIVDHGGMATMQQIYPAVEAQLQGRRLSKQGRDSLRFFVNKVAVEDGLVYPYDRGNPGWRITDTGRAFLTLPPGEQQDALSSLPPSDEPLDLDFLDEELADDSLATAWPPEPLDGPAFVILYKGINERQRYGETYDFSNYASGDARKLIDALTLNDFERDGRRRPVYFIIYRPGPEYAFTAWTRATSVIMSKDEQHDEEQLLVNLDWHEFTNHVKLKEQSASLLQRISWLRGGLKKAFNYRSIRKISEDEFQEIIAEARTVTGDVASMTMSDAAYTILVRAGGGPLHLSEILRQAEERGLIATSGQTPQLSLSSALLRDLRFNNLGKNMWVLAESVTVDEEQSEDVEADYPPSNLVLPKIYAGAEAQFWRIHFPADRWPAAREHGFVGIEWPPDSTNQSVRNLKRVKVGDRVVVYLLRGQIGGVGIVTEPFFDIRAQGGVDQALEGSYPQRIGVVWNEELGQVTDLQDKLTQPRVRELYNKFRNPHTVAPLTEIDYAVLLALLNVDDTELTPNPNAWPTLTAALSFIHTLDSTPRAPHELLDMARVFGHGFNTAIDQDALVDDLRQFRLLQRAGEEHYLPQPYVFGDQAALLRLMALALLMPVEGSADVYRLPSRILLPLLQNTQDPQPIERFGSEFGADGPQLLAWYAEAGLVELAGDIWQPAPDAFAPLVGDDPATKEYNRFLATLQRDVARNLPTDLPAVEGPLPPVIDLDARLHRISRRLLIDPQIVKRVYRSLIAGRHVVLSGPPGTGKTELAKLLPELLWQEPEQEFTFLTTDLDQPPLGAKREQRHGYAPIVVTATEDWGVRDVVGGIGPRLDGSTIGYTIEHGALTRVVLQHYEGSDAGRLFPITLTPTHRFTYEGKRYRGGWLVIDEFTRAPVDAAFGGLLTTLGGGSAAMLAVPTKTGDMREVPLPQDFRIIGTLNSFDRHFLNQISEAIKRRFDFIDVPPPHPRAARYEQGIAATQALLRLYDNRLPGISVDETTQPPSYRWEGVLAVGQEPDPEGLPRPVIDLQSAEATVALDSFWRIFMAIRVFRQLGTAQVVALYTNLFAGVLAAAMPWPEALDTALADTLADQLQVLNRDEQELIDAYLAHAGAGAAFAQAVTQATRDLSSGRKRALLHALRAAEQLRHGQTALSDEPPQLSDEATLRPALDRIFQPQAALALPTPSLFQQRLRDLIGERGL